MKTSPTQRTLKSLRDKGYHVDIAERWIPNPMSPAGGNRKDLFGFVDIVYLGDTITAVQCTSGSNVSKRIEKIKTECVDRARQWLASGGRIEVWGWTKYKKPIDRRYWRERIIEITVEDL